jgi:hypothetical protein
MKAPTVLEFATDRQLLNLSLSEAQRVLLGAAYALPLTRAQRALYRECTGRSTVPPRPVELLTVVAGARSGKDSRIGSVVLLYEALFGSWPSALHRGETAVFPLVAADLRGTRVAFDYLKGYLLGSSVLRHEVADVLAQELTLTNGARIPCFPYRVAALRGWSIPCAVLGETAFWRVEGRADVDREVFASVERGTVAFPHSLIVLLSSPWRRAGLLWDTFTATFGQESPDTLTWQASTDVMNPGLLAKLTRHRGRDPQRYRRDFGAEFLADDATAFPSAWIEAAVVRGRGDLPPQPGVTYAAGVDTSGGGGDTFALVVAHQESGKDGRKGRVLVDLVCGWRNVRNRLTAVVQEIARLVKPYGIVRVTGDKYGASWVKERFLEAGLLYQDAPQDTSQTLQETEPLLAGGLIELPDHKDLTQELLGLERTLHPGGRVTIQHPPGRHDDYSAALARAVQAARVRVFPDAPVVLGLQRSASQDWPGAARTPAGYFPIFGE